jgi:hypothetical protein
MLKLGKTINILFITLLVILESCQNNSLKEPSYNFKDFDCLLGNWINDDDTSAILFENWTNNIEGNYYGVSFILAKKDTIFFESIKLTNTDSGVFYSVSVRNQNDAETIHFKLVTTERNMFKFENKKHEFPQSISYQYKEPDTLNAWIEGTINGKPRKESFLMWRKR